MISPVALTWAGLQAARLLFALCQHEVEFVVLGSVARVLRGDLRRTPHDLDIAPEQSDENLVRLGACLNELGVYGDKAPLVPTHVVLATFRGLGNALPLRSLYGRIEVCLHIAALDTYADLRPNATAVEVEGCMVMVASLEDIDRYDAVRPRG